MKKSVYEEFLANLSSPEGKGRISKVIDELKEFQQDKKNIISNNDYILWLEKFTITNPNFTTEDWLYYPNKISDEDKEQVKKLELFYSGIDMYAESNFIYPTSFEYGVYYKIKFNNIGYKISMVTGQGVRYFCKRVEIDNQEDFIDFNDISLNKKQPMTESISFNLEQLSELLNNMIDSNVPLEAIVITTDKILKRELKKRK